MSDTKNRPPWSPLEEPPDAPDEVSRIPADHGEHATFLPAILHSVTRGVSRRPASVLWIVGLLVLISLGVSARFLTFKTNRSDLIDHDSTFHQRWLKYADEFGEESDIVVVVEAEDTDLIKEALDDLGARLSEETELFRDVFYKFDPGPLRAKGLQYLPPEDLQMCLGQLDQFADVLEGRWDLAGLESLCHSLQVQLTAPEPSPVAVKQALLLTTSLQEFLAEQRFVSPWPSPIPSGAALDPDAFSPVYQLNDQGTMGFLLAVPIESTSDFQGSSRSIDRLRELIAEVDHDIPGVTIGLTGIPVLESDEMRRSQSDMALASLISFVGVGTILLIGFRGARHPALALIMLAVGLSWSLAYTTLAVGHLNILSVSFAVILIGLGIDFAIHYLARYLELRHEGLALRPALMRTSSSVGTGIVTAAVTTALAFFCATFTSFLGVAELGIIAGGGILICCMTAFVVLPALVAVADRQVEPRKLPTPFQGNLLRRMTSRWPGTVTLVTLGIIVTACMYAFDIRDGQLVSRVEYDSNLLHLQAQGVDSVEVQKHVFREAGGSLLYAVSLADSPDEVLRRRKEFEQLESVGRVEELASHFPPFPADETLPKVEEIHQRLLHVSDLPREFPQLNPQNIGDSLEAVFMALKEIDTPQAQKASQQLDGFLNLLEAMSLDQQVELLGRYQYALLSSLKHQFEALADMSDPVPVNVSDLPHAVRERFVSRNNVWLLRVFPADQVWDEEPLARFVSDVRSVDSEVTGSPLQNYEGARQIRESYLHAAVYALLAIWIVLLVDAAKPGPLLIGLITPLAVIGLAVLLIPAPQRPLNPLEMLCLYAVLATIATAIFDFRSVCDTFLSILPALGGSVLMCGLLGLFHVALNPANLIVLPLILGIGVDDGVHVLHDYRMQTRRYRTSASTINAIMLTSLTTMIGFGSMILADHRGLASLGLVLVIGVGSCLFVSLVGLPAILTLMSRQRRHASKHDSAEPAASQDATATVKLHRESVA